MAEANLCKEYYKNIEKTLINANITKKRFNGLIKCNKNMNANTIQTEKINLLKLLVKSLENVIAYIQSIEKLSTDYHNNKEMSGIKTSYLPEERSLDFKHIEYIFEYSNRFNEDNQLDNIDIDELKRHKKLLSELLTNLEVSQEMLRKDVTKLIEQRKLLFNLDKKELNNMTQSKEFDRKQEMEKISANREENKLKIQNEAAKELKELELNNAKDIHQIEENKLKMQNQAAKELKELELNNAKDIRQIEFDEQLKMKQSGQEHEINLMNAKLKHEIELRKMEISSNNLRSKSPLKSI